MKWPGPISRLFEWLEPASAKIRYEPPPGVGRVDLLVVALFVPSLLFAALLFASPAALAPGSTGDLSGRVGLVDNGLVWGPFPQPERWIYTLGDVACHTKSGRSFDINGNQMPFCARDVALFLGIVVGLGLCLSPRRRTYPAVVMLPWWSYLALIFPIALDGGAQDFLGFESDNLRRVLTGFPAGLAVAFSLVFILYESRFAMARTRARRQAKEASGHGAPRAQAMTGSDESSSTGSLASNAVEIAPTEKKNALQP